MNTLRYVGTDDPLTTEQGKVIRQRAVEAARRKMVARRLLPINVVGSGAQIFSYDTVTGVSAAGIDEGWPGPEILDEVGLSRTNLSIQTIHKEFEINAKDLESSRTSGTPLNTTNAESCAYQVSLAEDALILKGKTRDGTNYDINGLYKSASGNTVSGSDWATASAAITNLQSAMALMLADNIDPPYNLVVHPDQYSDLLELVSNTSQSYLTTVKDLIGGNVFQTASMAATTAILIPADMTGMAEYVIAEDLTTTTEILQRSGNLFGRVYIRGVPVVYDSNAICAISGI